MCVEVYMYMHATHACMFTHDLLWRHAMNFGYVGLHWRGM